MEMGAPLLFLTLNACRQHVTHDRLSVKLNVPSVVSRVSLCEEGTWHPRGSARIIGNTRWISPESNRQQMFYKENRRRIQKKEEEEKKKPGLVERREMGMNGFT